MANKRNIEIQDHEGNIYNPHTAAKVVFLEDGKNVESQLAQMATELESVKQSGVNAKSKMVTSINSKKTVPDVTVNDTWDTMSQRVADIKECSGNALKADVRRGKTFTNNDGVEYTGELDIAADKILKGQNIGGVNGTATSDSNAVAGDIISGKTAYVNGAKVTGNIVERGNVSAPCVGVGFGEGGFVNVQVPTGAYRTSYDGLPGYFIAQAPDANFVRANIKKGVSVFGLVGTLSSKGTIKSIQKGVTSFVSGYRESTVNISSVDWTKSILLIDYSYEVFGSVGYANYLLTTGEPINNTSFKLKRNTGNSERPKVFWQVIEFENAIVQRGEFHCGSDTQVTISNIDTNNTIALVGAKGSGYRISDSTSMNVSIDSTFLNFFTELTATTITVRPSRVTTYLTTTWQTLTFL